MFMSFFKFHPPSASLEQVLGVLRAAGEPTRLRLLALLKEGELNVTDLTTILGQSQPRISRHLKLLAEAKLIERYREGSWAFFRLAAHGMEAALCRDIIAHITQDDTQCQHDLARLKEVRKHHTDRAALYFSSHAAEWDKIRALHVSEQALETAIDDAFGTQNVQDILDIGTGTGRMLELFAKQAVTAVGVDQSLEMLSVARANLARAGLSNVQLRHGDIYDLPMPAGSFDRVIVHQVLHFLEEPAKAIKEAARVLRPQGQLIVVDFAPHDLEFLREQHAHRRLGFDKDILTGWMEQAGLTLVRQHAMAPPDNLADGLTVSLWVGQNQAVQCDSLSPMHTDRAIA